MIACPICKNREKPECDYKHLYTMNYNSCYDFELDTDDYFQCGESYKFAGFTIVPIESHSFINFCQELDQLSLEIYGDHFYE